MPSNPSVLPDALSIRILRELYRSGRVTPQRVLERIVRRSAETADRHIWITPPDMQRLKPYLDRLADLDPERYPLWGIPFAVKDNIDVAGMPTTAGCPDYAYLPDEHATVVARLVSAGAIPVGKANLDQFATGLVGTRSPYGETRNVLRPELISGGSSSGSAAAVAAGLAAFALGTDTAGSGRVPAALHGLVGWKPSLGAWPTRGVVPACASLDCVTVFTLDVADARLVDHIVRGIDEEDPWSRRVPVSAPRRPAKLCLPAGELSFFGPYAEGYERAWRETVERVRRLDIPVEFVDTSPFTEAAALLYQGPWVAERWAGVGGFAAERPEAVHPVTLQVLRTGAEGAFDAAAVFRAMHRLQELKRESGRLLRNAVFILPTCGGTWTREQVREDPIGANSRMGAYTNHCNLLDLCALAVPSGDAAARVPFGVTLFAAAGEEGMLAETAALLAEAEQTTLIAVCGLHMRGFPLETQMLACGARFAREAETAAAYRLVKLPTAPPKPGLVRIAGDDVAGDAIAVELWEMPLSAFGRFAAAIPAPLGIGKVELRDGASVPGFICEGYAVDGAEDITSYGGWRNYMQSGSPI